MKPQLLVVDDEQQVLNAIGDQLDDEFVVHAATSGTVALGLLTELKDISVLLSDQRMPGMAGDELFVRASEISDAARVMITGYADLGAVVRAVNKGRIFGYITKPWEETELRMTLHKAAEHHRLVRELEHERNLLTNLMENVPDEIVFKSLDHRYTRVNRAFARRHGIPAPEAVIGRLDSDFMTDPMRIQLIHEEDRRVIESRKPIEQDERLILPDGQAIWMSRTNVPVLDGAGNVTSTVFIARDITERKRGELELRKLSLAVRQSGTAIAITDPSGVIEYVNSKFEAMTGYSADEVIGRNPRFLKSGLTAPQVYRELWETILAGKEWRGEIQNRRKSGDVYYEEQHITPVLDDEGRVQHFIAMKDDVTARTQLARERERFRLAMDLSTDSIYLTDIAAMRFFYVNDAACRRLGHSRDQLQARGPLEVLGGSKERLAQEYAAVVAAGEAGIRSEVIYVKADGSQGVSEISRRAVPTDEGPLIVTIGRDITDRKRADEKIRRLNRVHAVLSGINSVIVRVQERAALFAEACRIAVDEGGFLLARVVELDKDGKAFVAAAAGTDSAEFHDVLEEYNLDPVNASSLVAHALRSAQPVVSNDIASDLRVHNRVALTKDGTYAIAILPLNVDAHVAGAFMLRAKDPGMFDDEEMDLLLELASDISFSMDHIAKAARIEHLAMYDQLTGLANRALLLERVGHAIQLAGASEGKFALALVDVERFRTVNESLGRQSADAVIREIGARLEVEFGKAEVARMGADHFALMLHGIKGKSEVTRRIARVWQGCFALPFQIADTQVRLSAKSGIAMFPRDGAMAERLLDNAEAALERAKASGERLLFYTSDMLARTKESLDLESRLRQALERQEFVLHYQPKVDLDRRCIVGVEALIRWQSPDLGLVAPGRFIPLLEETGLILEVGAWALGRAVDDHARWSKLGISAPRIAVNVSAIQLRRGDFVATVAEALERGETPPGIDLEVTESLLMEDVRGSIEKLNEVRKLGVNIAIDDFGTGYSSLGYLAKLPVHTLKIDRAFIISMLNDPDTMTLVSTMITLAHSLRLTVVAEGVEEEEQAKMLHLLRCDQIQGYLFSKPVPFEQMTTLLQRQESASAGPA